MGLACAAGATIADLGFSVLHVPSLIQGTLVSLDLLDAKPELGEGLLELSCCCNMSPGEIDQMPESTA